jgi:hypothetical protein
VYISDDQKKFYNIDPREATKAKLKTAYQVRFKISSNVFLPTLDAKMLLISKSLKYMKLHLATSNF